MGNRYVVTLDFYLFGDNDEMAKGYAAIIEQFLEQECPVSKAKDFAITSIVQQDFGTIGNREVPLTNL